MTTTHDVDRLAAAYLTRIAEPGNTQVGQAQALLGSPGALTLIDGDLGIAARMVHDPFDPDKEAARVAAWRERGIHLITRDDEELWPGAVGDLGSEGPYALWYRGDVETLKSLATGRSVAIVGARASTSYGNHVAHELASDLSQDHLVVSGGAYGIDAEVHRAALAASERTVIVSAAGLQRAYPAGHNQLFEDAWHGKGLVISEVWPDSAPTKWRFLARNRLIAAFTPATIVVEAGYRSGSLNTAGHADAMHRKIGAVPGPITSAASAGCHRLIGDYRARVITSAADVRPLTEGWNQ